MTSLATVRAVALDVDGVLTDDGFWWGADGSEVKRFSFLDVMGVSIARRAGLTFALISGEASPQVDRYADKMSITHVYKGCRDKATAVARFAEDAGVLLTEVCFVGNDVNDLPAMQACGVRACPADAHPSVRAAAHHVSSLPSGRGAVRELLDLIVQAREASMTTIPLDRTQDFLALQLADHQRVMTETIATQRATVEAVVDAFCRCFATGNKLMFCGNGGSAADSQHIAAEFVNRLRFDRPALAALALTVDSSVLTCIANDSAYDRVFSRQVEALGRSGDVLVGISTSGGSPNVLRALERARAGNIVTVGFTGLPESNPMHQHCDLVVTVPSKDTARIQEAHEFTLHAVAAMVEMRLFGEGRD